MELPTGKDLATIIGERNLCLRRILDEPRSKSDLEDSLSCSRSTLDRAISELRDASLVRYDDGLWTATLLGWCAYNTRERYLDRLEDIAKAGPILKHLSTETVLDCSIVEGGTVHEAQATVPDAVITKSCAYMEKASSVRIATPTLMMGLLGGLTERVASKTDVAVELIVPKETYERAEATSPTLVERFIERCNVDLYFTVVPFSFGLWRTDEGIAGVLVFSDQGIEGLVVNDGDEALRWADHQLGQLKEQADRRSAQSET